ncbi:DNA-binding protein, partial [Salmonella enterica subsp. diarizonae]
MRDYGKVSPQFWIGKTGKALRNAGSEAQLVSLYLLTNPHANMIGLYYMPLMFIAHETGLGMEGASKGLASAIEAGFCHYDEQSEMVWVPEMSAHQIGSNLSPKDKRCPGVQNEYNAQPDNPFLSMFYDKYQIHYHMTVRRGDVDKNESESEGASKGLGSQEQEQEQEQDQNTLSDFGSNRTNEDNPASPEKPPATENPEPEQTVVRGSGNLPEPEPDQEAERTGDSDPPDKPDDREKPCEPDPVDQAFGDIFWKAGLCKVGKVKACSAFRTKYRAWKKSTHGSPPKFASMLASDIRQRLSAGVFGMDKLHPATYLNQERWNDELPTDLASPAGGTTPVRDVSHLTDEQRQELVMYELLEGR